MLRPTPPPPIIFDQSLNIENNNKVVARFDSLNLVGVTIVSKIQLVAYYQSCVLIG